MCFFGRQNTKKSEKNINFFILFYEKTIDIIKQWVYYNNQKGGKPARRMKMNKAKMIEFFKECGFSALEAEKEARIHVAEIKRVNLPDLITEEQAAEYFLSDLVD